MQRNIFDYLAIAAVIAGGMCMALQRFSDTSRFDGLAMIGALLVFIGVLCGVIGFAAGLMTRGRDSGSVD